MGDDFNKITYYSYPFFQRSRDIPLVISYHVLADLFLVLECTHWSTETQLAYIWLTLSTLTFIWYQYSPHCSHYISCSNDKENLCDNQELLKLVIISIILITFILDSRVILWGEIRCQSLLEVKGLNEVRSNITEKRRNTGNVRLLT